MKTKKKLVIIAVSLVLALSLCAVTGAVVSSVTPGGEAQVGNLTIGGKTVATPTNLVYVCSNTPNFTGTTNPNATIAFRITGGQEVTGSTTTDANGTFAWTSPTLENGQHEVNVVVTDRGGSTAETLIATITTECSSGLTAAGVMIAKIAIIALAIFMVIMAGYFALKRKSVRA
jgi:hypothetical protein